ncbi:MAG: cupredoxin domain-containing protein [Dehalococcoidia bacterium]|nr:cupredoxin domain-containing protein [Dehalococcoidia bacterium]
MKPTHWLWTLAVPLLAFSLLAGLACGDDDNGGSTKTATSTGAATSTGEKNPEIDQKDLAFKPETLTIKAGQKVDFKNSETALHTVNINGKNESGTMKKGDLFVRLFDKAGSYKITCDFHPQMNATVTVE